MTQEQHQAILTIALLAAFADGTNKNGREYDALLNTWRINREHLTTLHSTARFFSCKSVLRPKCFAVRIKPMIRKCKSLILVWALAFLQCLAPLMHAHAGGLHAVADAHIHFDGLHIGATHKQVEFSAHHVDAPSVSTPAQLKRDPVFSPSSADLAIAVTLLSQPTFAVVASTVPQTPLPPSRFIWPSPPARAPPAAFPFL